MDNLTADFEINPNNPLNAEYELSEGIGFDCSFELFAAGTVWGSIDGDINNQTDLINLLNTKVDLTSFEELSQTVTNNYNELTGDIADLTTTVTDNYNTLSGQISDLTTTVNDNYTSLDNRLTTAEGSILNLTDTVNDNYTELNGKITTTNNNLSTLSQTVENNNTAINNRVDGIVESFDGDISDLNNAIDNLSDTVSDNYTDLDDKISDLTDTVNDNDTAINSKVDGINTTLTTSINNLSNTVTSNYTTLDTKIDNTKTSLEGDISDLSDTVNQNYTDLSNAITTSASTINSRIDGEVSTLNTAIGTETTNRQNADNNLQSQIDAIVSSSDVFDIVGTYAELQAYDISTVPVNDIIKVLVDSSHDNTATYYRCIETGGIKSWSYIGSEGAYYTKSESDTKFVAKTTTINNIPLSSNITLTASDVNALPDTTVIGDGVLTLQKNGVNIDTFNANATANKSINITVPTDTADLTNGAGFITSASLPTVNNGTLDIQVNGTSVGTFTANQSGNTTANIVVPDSATWGNITGTLSNQTDLQNALNAKQNTISDLSTIRSGASLGTTALQPNDNITELVNNAGYITGITSSDVTTALGYTPYNSTNPSGYITSADLPTNYVTTDTVQNISGRKTFLGEKAIYFKQTATTDKLGFTLYNPSNTELGALEWRPNTINGNALLALNCPQSGSNYVGFRYWSNINIVAPRPTTDGNYFIPVNITDGTNTVTANNNGTLNISTLLPTVNNGTLTIQKNGTTVGTFTANDTNNVTANISVPTSISNLTDDTATTPIDKAESVVDNNSGSLTFWSGTKAQYDAIVTKDANTLYNVEDTTSPIISILDSLYPVGSIYIGTMSACPLQTLGVGTWQLVATDRVLQGAGTRGSVGNTLNESLPNITGNVSSPKQLSANYNLSTANGAFSSGGQYGGSNSIILPSSTTVSYQALVNFNAHNSNATYQDNAPVQQDAYLVNIWERVS